MNVIVLNTQAAVAREVARRIATVVASPRRCVIGLATGATMEPVYNHLVNHYHERTGLSFRRVRVAMLDEYVGLDREHPCSYNEEVRSRLLSKVDARSDGLVGFDGAASDLEAEATHFEARLAEAGGVDLQLLGIGRLGHIGFNEPGSSLRSRTRVVTLDPATRTDNSRLFPEDVEMPVHALTQGVGTILEASELVVVAVGQHKAAIVAEAVEGPLTASVPRLGNAAAPAGNPGLGRRSRVGA